MTTAPAHLDRRGPVGGVASPIAVVTLAWRFRRRADEPEGTLRVRLEIERGRVTTARWDVSVGGAPIGAPSPALQNATAATDEALGLLHIDGAPALAATIDLRTGAPLYARTALLGALGAGPGTHETLNEPAISAR